MRTLICIDLSGSYYATYVHADISGTVNQQSSIGGAVYTRWGRKTCPGNGTDLLYWGTHVIFQLSVYDQLFTTPEDDLINYVVERDTYLFGSIECTRYV